MKWTTNYSAGGVCIIGCSGSRGTAANQLRGPRDLKFDQYGNLEWFNPLGGENGWIWPTDLVVLNNYNVYMCIRNLHEL